MFGHVERPVHWARHLLRLAQAVRLLGAQVLLCGLRPQVAQALVGVDVELGYLRTARSLQEALRALSDFVEEYQVLPDILNANNLMMRTDGTLVFSDPVFIA